MKYLAFYQNNNIEFFRIGIIKEITNGIVHDSSFGGSYVYSLDDSILYKVHTSLISPIPNDSGSLYSIFNERDYNDNRSTIYIINEQQEVLLDNENVYLTQEQFDNLEIYGEE